jgi:CelD/BcsL family acetyltransferase involved in cellulose biosynthesis
VDGDRLVGGLALEEERRLGLEYIQMMGNGPLCPDHLDLLATPGSEERVIDLFRAWLGRRGRRLVDLKGVRAGSRLGEMLPGPTRCEPLASAPWASLPDTADTYLTGLSSQFRRQVRRATARLEDQGVTHHVRRGASAIESLDTLRILHEAQWGDRSQFLPDFDRFRSACCSGAEVDEVVVHEMASQDTVVATIMGFEVAGRLSLYQSARVDDPRWREAPAALFTAIILDACDRGLTEVDFLRGEEPYKAKFASRRRDLVRLIAGSGGSGRIAWASTVAASKGSQAAVRSVQVGRAAIARARS